jgi:phosphoribosylformylglycinamidine synthase subunit PurL
VVLLGRTREELGGSEYLKAIHNLVKGTPPWIDLRLEKAIHNCCIEAIEQCILRSAHDLSDGGLAIALAESCVCGPDKALGARIEMREMIRGDALLFSESQSRILVSLQEKDLAHLQEIASKLGVSLQVIGTVGGPRLVIQSWLQIPVDELRSVWSCGLTERLQ